MQFEKNLNLQQQLKLPLISEKEEIPFTSIREQYNNKKIVQREINSQ